MTVGGLGSAAGAPMRSIGKGAKTNFAATKSPGAIWDEHSSPVGPATGCCRSTSEGEFLPPLPIPKKPRFDEAFCIFGDCIK